MFYHYVPNISKNFIFKFSSFQVNFRNFLEGSGAKFQNFFLCYVRYVIYAQPKPIHNYVIVTELRYRRPNAYALYVSCFKRYPVCKQDRICRKSTYALTSNLHISNCVTQFYSIHVTKFDVGFINPTPTQTHNFCKCYCDVIMTSSPEYDTG